MKIKMFPNMKLGNDILIKLLNQFNPEQLRKPIYSNGCCVHWIAGHIAKGRKIMLEILEIQNRNEVWLDIFKRGSSGQYSQSWPEISKLKDYLEKSVTKIYSKLENQKNILQKEATSLFSEEKQTVGYNLQFLMFHEAYHIGQIGMTANLFGLDPGVK